MEPEKNKGAIEESSVVGLENLMPQRDVVFEDTTYRIYLEEKVNGTDRCFGISSPEQPENIKLFQITTPLGTDKNTSFPLLSNIDIENDNTVNTLLEACHSVFKRVGKTKTIRELEELQERIKINDDDFDLTYQPATAGIVNLREQYEKRVIRRI